VLREDDEEPSNGKTPTLASVERALAILQTFRAEEVELTAKEIMARTGLRKATAFRFLSVLCRSGFIMHDPASGLYSPGFALLSLASMAQRRKALVMMALPTMRRIRDELNETVYLSVLANDHRIEIEQVESRGEVVRVKQLGLPKPLYASGPSRLLLALSDDDFINDYLRVTPMIPFSDDTMRTPEQLWANIRLIRRMGYAESENELNFGGANVSAPIYGHFDDVVGVVTAMASKNHYTPELRARTVKLIIEGGAEISERIQAGRKLPVSSKRTQVARHG
jgi:DNA-binding IclR family transcriptional regulator